MFVYSKDKKYAEEIRESINIKVKSMVEVETHLTEDISIAVLSPQVQFL